MKKFGLIFIAILTFAEVFAQKHEIKIQFKNLSNDTVILGHYFAARLIPDDTVVTNKKGRATFKGEKYPGGMYFMFFSNRDRFDFLLDNDQKFSISGDTANLLESIKYKGCSENIVFVNYQKFLSKSGEKTKKLRDDRKKFAANKQKVKSIDSKLKKLGKEMNKYFEKTVNDNPNIFFTKFLKATKDPEVPETIKDRKAKYYYYKNHYFQNFDVSDPRLLRTPIFESKIEKYLNKVVIQHPDTLIKECDKLIEKSRTNKELFRFMLVKLFNTYGSSQLMTAENVYVHLAEKYYLKEADWSKSEFIDKLKGKVTKLKNCMIGSIAKNIFYRELPADSTYIKQKISEMKEFKNKGLQIEKKEISEDIKYNEKVKVLTDFYSKTGTKGDLYSVKSKYKILWFWTPSCSHCRKETPIFYKEYEEKKLKEKGVEIISVFLNDDINPWEKFTKYLKQWMEFVLKHKMYEWTNTFNPFGSFRNDYAIESSPVLYLLDEDNKILAKKIGYEQAFKIIEEEEKRKSKNK